MISVICPTYARTHLLEELIACFLAQTMEDAELVVLNDHPGQTLIYEHPRVRVVNAPQRFPWVWQKIMAAVDLSEGDRLCFWDDDDLYLPDHLERLQALLAQHRGGRAARQHHEWADGGHRLYRYIPSQPTHCLMLDADLFYEVGGIPQTDVCADFLLIASLLRGRHLVGPPSMIEPPTCIYRHAGGIAHMSQVDQANIAQAMVADAAARAVPLGRIELAPVLREDYAAKAAASWTAFSQTLPR